MFGVPQAQYCPDDWKAVEIVRFVCHAVSHACRVFSRLGMSVWTSTASHNAPPLTPSIPLPVEWSGALGLPVSRSENAMVFEPPSVIAWNLRPIVSAKRPELWLCTV